MSVAGIAVVGQTSGLPVAGDSVPVSESVGVGDLPHISVGRVSDLTVPAFSEGRFFLQRSRSRRLRPLAGRRPAPRWGSPNLAAPCREDA
jgi:hypothetical protein